MKKIVLLAFVLVLFSFLAIVRCAKPFSTNIPVQTLGKASKETNTVIHPIADTYVDSQYHWENKGNSDILAVWNGTTKYISFLKFDLCSLSSTTITSAMLFLRVVVHSVDSNQTSIVGVHCYNESWNEDELAWDTVNWSSLNQTAIDTTEIYLDLLEHQVWFNWTITQDVQSSKGSFLTEVVRAENDVESIFFSSRETSYMPHLNITYIELSVRNIDSGKNFSTIQEAINDNETLDGHTIFVEEGYYKHVVVNKSISLIEENKETTIIDGDRTDNVIHITADNANISGFTLQNSGRSQGGIYLDHSGGCNISYNMVANNDFGIELWSSDNNVLTGNNVSSNTQWGMRLIGSNNNSFTVNTVSTNGWGVHLESSYNNTVATNTVSSNSGHGIILDSSGDNTVAANIISKNQIGIHIKISSINNTIMDNTLSNNDYGVYLYSYSDKNTLTNNTVSNNALYGIYIDNSVDNVIYHNNFINNTHQVYSDGSRNTWDNGYPSGGNYWSDYEDKYPDAEEIDGIWDTPYVIDENDQDNYPIVPEFPTWTSMLLILIVLTAATAIYKRRLLKTPTH